MSRSSNASGVTLRGVPNRRPSGGGRSPRRSGAVRPMPPFCAIRAARSAASGVSVPKCPRAGRWITPIRGCGCACGWDSPRSSTSASSLSRPPTGISSTTTAGRWRRAESLRWGLRAERRRMRCRTQPLLRALRPQPHPRAFCPERRRRAGLRRENRLRPAC